VKEPERDYSHRSLLGKLGVKPEYHVAAIGKIADDFLLELNTHLAKGASRALRGVYDIIFLQVNAPRDLERVPVAASHLNPAGGLWIFHPKGRGANPTDSQVRAIGLASGLVDNKISAYSETHTATRYVIPVAKRRR
jgi:hypothetical protein